MFGALHQAQHADQPVKLVWFNQDRLYCSVNAWGSGGGTSVANTAVGSLTLDCKGLCVVHSCTWWRYLFPYIGIYNLVPRFPHFFIFSGYALWRNRPISVLPSSQSRVLDRTFTNLVWNTIESSRFCETPTQIQCMGTVHCVRPVVRRLVLSRL